MARFKVLLTDYAWPDVEIERRILGEADAELVVAPTHDTETLRQLASDVDAIMVNWAQLTEAVIGASPRLKIVARFGIGLDNIDVQAATRRRIVVTNVPDYCLDEVAEHALALILSLARKVAFYHHETKAGNYQLQAGPPLRRIAGQTLGIIGFGHIGRLLAEKAIGVGLHVLITGRAVRTDLPAGVRWVGLEELLSRSDYVSLHVPFTATTRHLIGASELARMKPSAYLINTARGGLVDHLALAGVLDANLLAGAALDVQDPEPPNLKSPPLNDPRVIVTPHCAFVSVEALENLRTRTARQVVDRLLGNLPENAVNPRVLEEPGQ